MEEKGLQKLGIVTKGDRAFLFYNLLHHHKGLLSVDVSENGADFKKLHKHPMIVDKSKREEDIEKCTDFRISDLKNKYFLTYKYKSKKGNYIHGALSSDLMHWQDLGKIQDITEIGMVVPHYRYQGKTYIMYYGENSIKVAQSEDLKSWQLEDAPILVPQETHIGTPDFKIGNIILTKEGILVIFFVHWKEINQYSIYTALFDKTEPDKLLWKTEQSIWDQPEEWRNKTIYPVGIINLGEKLLSYWEIENEGIFAVTHSIYKQISQLGTDITSPMLDKFAENPIIKPIVDNFWESKATFNPAAVYIDGKVHLVYRAVGDNDTSVLGYAMSEDGIHISTRAKDPIYIPKESFEYNGQGPVVCSLGQKYASGGGYGGCEDPRLTKIDDTLYLTYVAYDGANPPRVALSSILVDDFLNKKWYWQKSVLISPPGIVDKNAVIFPEKIMGKYVIFHRIFPNILIDFVDSLKFDGQTWLKDTYQIRPSLTSWDSRKIGAGPPPIKTDRGWLLIYHSVGEQDPGRYKMGAMLLDLKDPRRVIARSKRPILEPNQWYENEGYKSGVAYPCGAVAFKNRLHVYYGGADQVVCVATSKLNNFLNKLDYSDSGHFTKINKIKKLKS